MKNFGKMVASREVIDIPGEQIGVNEEGEPVFAPDQKQPVLIFRDVNGADWFDLAKEYPHAFYIALDDENRIISMTDDYQNSQIADYNLVGIDNDFGFTFGPGGNVYGKRWNGEAIVLPELTKDDVIAECNRRLGLGFDYDFGDARGIHHIGTSETDMRRWMDEVTPLAQAHLNSGQPNGQILIATDTAPVTVTAQEWQFILIAASNYRQPLYQASFALQAMKPIPADYRDDSHWKATT